MNTLSYGLMSLLSQSSLSGYDLMLRIQPFWPAKHSQIYPLLAQLEKDEHVRYEHITQSDKPDKKVYSLTDKGIAALQQWLSEPASDPVIRDELSLKTFCMSLVDKNIARAMFVNRLEHYKLIMRLYEEKILNLQQKGGWTAEETPPFSSPLFGVYVLIHKATKNCQMNIDWCEWVLKLMQTPPIEEEDSRE
jgi:DNA-binding PadR family transcriptional regulator